VQTKAVGTRSNPKCPRCNRELERVKQTSGMLNDDQFDAVKAGDYFTPDCDLDPCAGSANGVTSTYRYFGEIEGRR
jgi:hypothetical protein